MNTINELITTYVNQGTQSIRQNPNYSLDITNRTVDIIIDDFISYMYRNGYEFTPVIDRQVEYLKDVIHVEYLRDGINSVKDQYDALLASGMFWSVFPELTGTWEHDKHKFI